MSTVAQTKEDMQEEIARLRAELQNAAKAALDAVALSCAKEREADALRAEAEALRKDAERWQHARKLLSVDDIAARQPVGEPVPSIPSELAPVVAALKRFDECAEDCDSEGCDIGRAWFDALTTMGLLKRTQRSPAVWTMTAEGERLLDLIYSHSGVSRD